MRVTFCTEEDLPFVRQQECQRARKAKEVELSDIILFLLMLGGGVISVMYGLEYIRDFLNFLN